MADRTSRGETQPRLDGRRRTIYGVAKEVFRVDRSPFSGGDIAAIEARRGQLIGRGMRQEIACELFDGELVETEIPIKRAHNPVPIRPHLAFVIKVHSMGIGITG